MIGTTQQGYWTAVRREPFRFLFPLGALCGCIGVGHWLVYGLGWSASYSGFFHASVQTGLYMPCFIVGFLLTALPRFSAAPPASARELAAVLGLVAVQAVGVATGRWPLAEGALTGLLVFLGIFAGRRFLRKRSGAAPAPSPPMEFVWVPIALLHGLLGAVLLIGGQIGAWPAWTLAVGRPMMQQGFLLGVVLGVGGFMAPRLMGRALLLSTAPGMTAERFRQRRRRRILLHLAAGAGLLASFLLEGAERVVAAYGLRALLVTAELCWTTRFVKPPAVTDGYVQLVWLSLWMVVLGLWGACLAPAHRVAALHLTFLGGFSLMTFAVATMVVLSHAGEGEHLRRPLWVLRVTAAGVACAIVGRLIADAQPEAYFRWLAAASVCWVIAGVSWIAFILPRVLRPAAPDAFEQVHAAVKAQILTLKPPRSTLFLCSHKITPP